MIDTYIYSGGHYTKHVYEWPYYFCSFTGKFDPFEFFYCVVDDYGSLIDVPDYGRVLINTEFFVVYERFAAKFAE